MEPLEAPKPTSYRALARERAEKLVRERDPALSLDSQRHPLPEKLEGLRELAGLVLVEEFDADAYYDKILPWYRSPDRAKEHVLSHFESLCGRLPPEGRAELLKAIGSGARWQGLCARDGEGRRWFVALPAGEELREVRLSASQSEAYERARKRGGLGEVPTLA